MSLNGAWQQAGRNGVEAVGKRLHLIHNRRQRETDRETGEIERHRERDRYRETGEIERQRERETDTERDIQRGR